MLLTVFFIGLVGPNLFHANSIFAGSCNYQKGGCSGVPFEDLDVASPNSTSCLSKCAGRVSCSGSKAYNCVYTY
jgi:hypothetical protein